MDRNLPDIEELFKSALENEEEMPEPKVWKGIDQILDKDHVVSIKKKYDDLKKVAILLFFMLFGIGIYEFQKQTADDDHNFSEKRTVAEKTNGASSIDKSNGAPIKIVEPHRLNKKSERIAGRPVIVEDGYGNNKKSERNSPLIDDQKPAKDYKRKTTDGGDVALDHVCVYNTDANQHNVIEKTQKEKLVDHRTQTDEKPLFKDFNSSYAQQPRPLNPDSINPISLRGSPVLIKVVAGSSEKNSTVENIKTKNTKASPFSLNLFFSPDFASYHLRDNVPGNNVNEATEIEKDERHEFSTTMGALIEYRANKHWSIQSGLTYSNTNITVAPKTIYAQADNSGSIKYLLNTSSGYGYVLPSFSNSPNVGDSVYAYTSTHTLQYLSLPVALKYYGITKGKFSFNATAGMNINYLIKGKVETSVEDGTNNEPEVVNNLHGLKKFYFSALAGVGMDYNLTKKVAITFAPTYRFALNSINKDANVKSYPNSLGFATGLRFCF